MAPHRAKTSEVWNHFTEIEHEKAQCGYCSSKISTARGSLNNLRRHMKSKHALIPLNTNTRNSTEEISDDPIMPGCELTQGPSTSETVPQTTAEPSGTSWHRTNGQTTLSGYLNQTKPLNVNHQKRIDHQLVKMIVKGC